MVFFLHWSWKVSEELVDRYECVAFHMTDLPYGRGGSPLQHLILRGHRRTMLTAFRMTRELDAGPIYAKAPLSLEGSADAVYRRTADLAARMTRRLIARPVVPTPQRGRVVRFIRRTPAQSRIPARAAARALHDFIRMLDADGYPHAFLEHEGFRVELTGSRLVRGAIVAQARITPMQQPRSAAPVAQGAR
jgi:methionyl-tRNA formyltransferase